MAGPSTVSDGQSLSLWDNFYGFRLLKGCSDLSRSLKSMNIFLLQHARVIKTLGRKWHKSHLGTPVNINRLLFSIPKWLFTPEINTGKAEKQNP
ncbi:hypothetical protein CEXT_770801 [Caerostris extrusa]|uniref:Maturase K n=1 Tax=Caerostris extrusa TaxID=172846 RepID=A0AAV4VSH3_CAEEX|nr:hypothetical protein CEXT_770801 [Caerostris extrusa]